MALFFQHTLSPPPFFSLTWKCIRLFRTILKESIMKIPTIKYYLHKIPSKPNTQHYLIKMPSNLTKNHL